MGAQAIQLFEIVGRGLSGLKIRDTASPQHRRPAVHNPRIFRNANLTVFTDGRDAVSSHDDCGVSLQERARCVDHRDVRKHKCWLGLHWVPTLGAEATAARGRETEANPILTGDLLK